MSDNPRILFCQRHSDKSESVEKGPRTGQFFLSRDLIVLSSRRIDRDRPAGGIGTISHQVVLVCDCPVLLIR